MSGQRTQAASKVAGCGQRKASPFTEAATLSNPYPNRPCRSDFILLAVEIEVSFEGPFPRSVPIPRWKLKYQQLSKFLATSNQVARSIRRLMVAR